MWDYLIGITFIPVLFFGWLVVQSLARLFARAHPELGMPREEGTGCGHDCQCSNGSCDYKNDLAQR